MPRMVRVLQNPDFLFEAAFIHPPLPPGYLIVLPRRPVQAQLPTPPNLGYVFTSAMLAPTVHHLAPLLSRC